MIDWIWHSVWAQLSIVTIAVIVCGVVAWFIPPFRRLAVTIGGAVAAYGFALGKGARDQRKAQEARDEKRVKKVEEKYDKIDKRKDTDKDVEDRLDRGKF